MDLALLEQPLASTAAPHPGSLPMASETPTCSQISNGVDSVPLQGNHHPPPPPPLQGPVTTSPQVGTQPATCTPAEAASSLVVMEDHTPNTLANELPSTTAAPRPAPTFIPSTTPPLVVSTITSSLPAPTITPSLPPLAPTITPSLPHLAPTITPSLPHLAPTVTPSLPHLAPTVTATTLPPPPPLSATTAIRLLPANNSQVSPPSLHANEEMLSDSEDEEEMDTRHKMPPPTCPPPPALSDSQSSQSDSQATSAPPTIITDPPSVRSDSVSPYAEADDDSFASFVAREVHETASLMEEDRSSISRSPTPLPPFAGSSSSGHSSNDISALMNFIQSVGEGSGQDSSSSAMIQQFGVTANCPPTPVTLPEGSLPAPLDMTALNFPKRSKYAHRAALSAMHPYNRTRGGGASVAKTLDLLKAVLQSSFNMEVKRLCDDYLGIFTMAAGNVRSNTGDSVPDPTLKLLVCKMLEEAQNGYVDSKWEFPSGKLPKNDKVFSAKGSPMSTKKAKPERSEMKYGPAKRVRKAPTERHAEKSGGWRWGMDKRRVDPGKWEPDKLTTETDFVLGVNVNKALGHAANRGKVYYLHPELFKYACDGDDKTWLYENKYLPVHGGKAFLMIFTEVEALIETDAYYRDNPEVRVAVKKLQFFQVPVFMIEKMKNFMRSVQGYFAQEASTSTSVALEPKA